MAPAQDPGCRDAGGLNGGGSAAGSVVTLEAPFKFADSILEEVDKSIGLAGVIPSRLLGREAHPLCIDLGSCRRVALRGEAPVVEL